ncbi:hypothetical protein FRB93_001087 [Tulasnella sp. JGI-2019a]|nr:hypothetical protein FRB93_001087 [Tulasnella sp. JGI-2019a]
MENIDTLPDHSLRSLARVEWLSFSGGPSEHVLLFAQAVHRFAFAFGRQKDNAWIADYVYGCLSGEALNWFEDLDHDVKKDWSRLRPEMITEFRQSKLASTAPVAASGSRLVAKGSVSRSRVRVVRGNGTVLGYLSPPTREPHATVVASADEALVLDIPKVWDAQQNVMHIGIVSPTNDNNRIPYPFVGLESCYNADHWRFRACEEGPEGSVFKERARADTKTDVQEASSKVWSIKKLDGSIEELCASWMNDSGTRSSLQATIPPPSASPLQVWMRKSVKGAEESVKLILERF